MAAVLPDVVVPAGGLLDLGGFTLQDPVGSFVVPAGGSITGAGSVVVSVAGSVEVDGLVSARSVQVGQVGLLDGSGSVVVNGGTFGLGGSVLGSVSVELTAGTDGTWFRGSGLLGTSGTTTVDAGASLVSADGSGLAFANGTLVNNGTVEFAGGVVTGMSGTIRNNGDWVMDWSGSGYPPGVVDASPDGSFGFVNNGSVQVDAGDGGNSAQLKGYAGGTGDLSVTVGMLAMTPAGDDTVALPAGMTIPAGATLELDNIPFRGFQGAFQVPAGNTITGPGTLQIDGRGVLTINGTVTGGGLVDAGVVVVGGVVSDRSVSVLPGGVLQGSGGVRVNGGVFSLAGSVSGSVSLELAAGTVGTWSGGCGSLGSSGVTRVDAGASLGSGDGSGVGFANGTLVNNGTVEFAGGTVAAQSGTIRNNSDWVMDWSGSGYPSGVVDAGDGGFSFVNAGSVSVVVAVAEPVPAGRVCGWSGHGHAQVGHVADDPGW